MNASATPTTALAPPLPRAPTRFSPAPRVSMTPPTSAIPAASASSPT